MFTAYSISSNPTDIQFKTTPVYSDAHINYWADMYIALGLKRRGILLETFLAYPHDILHHVELNSMLHDHLPLLPEQKKVQERLWAEEIDRQAREQLEQIENIKVRNGRYVEPLHHKTWPLNHGRRMK